MAPGSQKFSSFYSLMLTFLLILFIMKLNSYKDISKNFLCQRTLTERAGLRFLWDEIYYLYRKKICVER